ncbi:putative carboxypeptidase A-like protein [Operophtera brumata]|uniref:Putative carboxypeptidase A-like protein n=1 Tax=Operophtera brumata TaxID=104452 RepID=A0A0L7K3M4_OPEBR|nr:putative carboxypeptidase A-like protein [Operophtera brumata]
MDTFDWQNYYKIDDIYKWLKDLAMAFPNEVVLESIGKTYENRDILACTLKNLQTRNCGRSRTHTNGILCQL